MPAPSLLPSLLTHLVNAGVVRRHSVDGPLPPMRLDPKLGVPAPGDVGSDASLGAFVTHTVAARPHESELRMDIVEVKIRTTTSEKALSIEQSLRAALSDKANWTMGSAHVVQSLEWRGLRRDGSSDDGYSYSVTYIFERRA